MATKWWVPALIASVFLNIFFLIQKPIATGVKVIGVIDGDTIVLEGKSRVRLRYVDAPEKELCGYQEASGELEKLALGKFVRIEETIPDQYGRGMALVYAGNTIINKEMVASGWVRYHHDTTSMTDEIKAVSDQAKQEKLGVYGMCESMVNTKNPKCTIKGNIDRQSFIYHLPGCVQYQTTVIEEDVGERWFCSEKEAQAAGFTRAKTCK